MFTIKWGLNHFTAARDALDNFEFEEQRGDDLVVKEAIGVSGLVTPWNFLLIKHH